MAFEEFAGDMVSHLPGEAELNIRHMTIAVWTTAQGWCPLCNLKNMGLLHEIMMLGIYLNSWTQ
jgi:hypothetical protein